MKRWREDEKEDGDDYICPDKYNRCHLLFSSSFHLFIFCFHLLFNCHLLSSSSFHLLFIFFSSSFHLLFIFLYSVIFFFHLLSNCHIRAVIFFPCVIFVCNLLFNCGPASRPVGTPSLSVCAMTLDMFPISSPYVHPPASYTSPHPLPHPTPAYLLYGDNCMVRIHNPFNDRRDTDGTLHLWYVFQPPHINDHTLTGSSTCRVRN